MFQSFKGKCTALLMKATVCWIALPCLFMERQSNSRGGRGGNSSPCSHEFHGTSRFLVRSRPGHIGCLLPLVAGQLQPVFLHFLSFQPRRPQRWCYSYGCYAGLGVSTSGYTSLRPAASFPWGANDGNR